MQAEYIAKITGDTSGLEKAIQKANGSIKKLEQDEVLIKLNYDGNVQGFNAEFDKILKSCPDLTIQFQYNVNQKMLNQELDKLKKLQDLKLDINTNNADKKIQSMIVSLDNAIGKGQSQDVIESKIKEIYKYANTVKKLGGKINIDFANEIYKSVEDTDFEKIFNKLTSSTNIDKIKLFDIKGSVDNEIKDTEKRIEDFQQALSNLELKGASKNGLLSEIDEVRNEIKILRSDLNDMNKQLGEVSGEQFRNLADDIKNVNTQLQNALDKIARLSGENKLGSIVNQWQKQEDTKTNERYTAFNRSTLETSGAHAAADAEGVSERLIREAIQEMGGEADGFIHSHPNNIAAFSDTDIVAFYKLLNEGITQQVVTSFQQAMTIDMSKVDSSKSEEVIALIREKYDEAEQEIGTQFLRNNMQTVQQISNEIFDNNLVGNSLIDNIITNAKLYYNEAIEKLGNQITLNDYSSVVDNAISKAFNESTIASQKGTQNFSKVKTFMGDIADAIVESLGDIESNKDALQSRFQSILMDIFSTPDFLKEGVKSAIKVENISDFIDVNMLKQTGQQLGTAVTNGFREGIDAHSNSKEAERAVDDFANGVVDEFNNRTPDMQEAAANAGKAVSESFNEAVKEGLKETELTTYSPTQQFDNVIQQDLVYLENYKNTIAEINKLKVAPQTDETKQKMEELQKLANYFFGNISITRNQLGNDGGNFANDPYGTYKNRLSIQGYGDKAYEIFKIGNQIKSNLDIDNLTSSFSGISEELERIESKSESLRQSLGKDLTESIQYVKQLKDGVDTLAESYEILHDPSYAKDTSYLNAAKKDIESILSKFPELEQFKNRFTSEEQAWEFVKTDEWKNFLATLPQAKAYLESIGYDFEKMGQSNVSTNVETATLTNNTEKLEQEAQAAREVTEAINEKNNAESQTNEIPNTNVDRINEQTEAIHRLESENEGLRQQLHNLSDEYNHLNEEYGILQDNYDSNQSHTSFLEGELSEQHQITEEIRQQNEELQRRNAELQTDADQGWASAETHLERELQLQSELDAERKKLTETTDQSSVYETEATALQHEQEQVTQTANAIEDLTNKKRELANTQLPAVIPLVDNQAKATEAFYKDIAKYQQDIFSDTGASQSGEMIKYEAKELATLQENAEGAAKSKNKFAVANGAVLASIVKSLAGISSEGDALKSIISVIQSFNGNTNNGVSQSVDNQKSKVEQAVELTNELYNNQVKLANIKPGTNTANYDYLVQKIEEARKAIETLGLSEEEQAQVAERTKDAQVNAINAINEAERKRQVETDKTNAKFQQSVQQAEKLQATVKKQATSMMSNGKLMSAYGDQIKDILTRINAINTSVNPTEAINQLKKLQNELTEVSSAAQQAGKSGKTLGQMFQGRFKSLISYLGTFVSFYRIVSYVRTAISTIKELDTQLVDLRKTTTMTSSELERFYHTSSDVAKQMGVTTSEIISQASAWSRLGYSSNEAATEMAKLSSQFTSISPGMTTDNATDYLVSTMKAYGVEVDEVERKIMDNVNRIGNTFATTNAEIGEMLTRSSAAMKAANNSLEETIALESAAKLLWLDVQQCA